MITINRENLTFIYQKLHDDGHSLTLTLPLLYLDEVKELKFDLFYGEDNLYRTNICYGCDNTTIINITPNNDLNKHFDEIISILANIDFCINCDSINRSDYIFNKNCIKCNFIQSFKQTHSEKECTICQEKIENDFLKVTCCGQFFHKTCRFKYGKWQPCPLCRATEFSY